MDNRYAVEVMSMHVAEDDGMLAATLDGLVGQGESRSPFGPKLRTTEWFSDWNPLDEAGQQHSEGTWVYSNRISDFGAEQVLSFQVQLRLSSAIDPEDIDTLFFFYAMGMDFLSVSRRRRGAAGEPAFYGARIQEGSTLVEFYAGAVALGAAISQYPKIRTGVLQIVSDVAFLTRSVQKALKRSAELPLSDRKEPTISRPYEKYRQFPTLPENDYDLRRSLRENKGDWRV